MQVLTELVAADKFTGINRQLAAEAFLYSARIDAKAEDAVEVALREAKNSLESQSPAEQGSKEQ